MSECKWIPFEYPEELPELYEPVPVIKFINGKAVWDIGYLEEETDDGWENPYPEPRYFFNNEEGDELKHFSHPDYWLKVELPPDPNEVSDE